MNKTDAQIRDDIEAEFDSDLSFDASRIGVTVKDGVATLSGHVDTYAALFSARKAAQAVAGVQAVANEISVDLPFAFKRTDGELADSILSAFRMNVSIPADTVNVTVRDGWVTLDGSVNWRYQKNACEEAIRPLRGIRGISDNIVVKQAVKISAGEIRKRIQSSFQRHAHQDTQRIHITVADGTVLLEGEVPTFHEKDAAEAAAWGAPGVSKVDDRLVVRP